MPKPLQYRAGSIIYFQGDPADKVFILQNGVVDLIYRDIETGEDIHDKVQSGEFFGVKSTLGRFPREENAMALQNSTLLALTIAEFEALALGNTRIIMKMLKVFSGHLRRIHRKVSGMMDMKEHIKAEEGLFSIGEIYLKNKNFRRAHYVFSRYLTYYPTGANTDLAEKYMQQSEDALNKPAPSSSRIIPSPASYPSDPFLAGSFSSGSFPGASYDNNETTINLKAFERFERTFQPGEIIFSEYEVGDKFYLIQSGRVQLLKLIGDNEKTLDILQPSEMFGEMAILDNSPRSATAIALDSVSVLEFNRQNFEILMMGNPQIALKLLKMFCKRIYDTKRRYLIITLDEPQAKIADVFLMLDESLPLLDRTTEKRLFFVTMDDVAHWAGMLINETRDVLSTFAAQRRIEIYSDRILVKNINDFARYVGSRRRSQ